MIKNIIKVYIVIYINLLFFIQEDYLNITSFKTKYTPIVNIKKKIMRQRWNNVAQLAQYSIIYDTKIHLTHKVYKIHRFLKFQKEITF